MTLHTKLGNKLTGWGAQFTDGLRIPGQYGLLDPAPPRILLTSGGDPPTPSNQKSVTTKQRKSRSIDTLTTSSTSHSNERLCDTLEAGGRDSRLHAGDENEERGNWSGQADFLLSLLGYAVGLGNVWRFPYLCYRNGGGAFLIPYTIVLILVGMPLFYMELVIGQFTSCGPLTCWEFAPLFKGLGVAQLIISAEVSIYYNVIIAWSLFYLFSSFINITGLPWESCYNDWNTPMCYDKIPDVSCNQSSQQKRYPNGTCSNGTDIIGVWNNSLFSDRRPSASEEYYNRRVLKISSGIEDMGRVEWDLALCLVLAWIISFLCMVKGIKTTGKVVYFTALFPYVVLVILLIRGVTLDNASEGIIFYLKPDFSRLTDAGVRSDAAVQMFFSMSNCWGGLIALASYNRFHNNCYRDTIIVTISNFFTGILAGFVIFSFLGFMAGSMGISIDKVVDEGPGLAFVVYPEAVSRMPVSPLWAILFFLMLLTLGLDSQFATLETVLTSILDQCSWIRPHKSKVMFSLCVVLFLLGLPLCTHGGIYMLELMNSFCSGWNLLLIGLIESIAVAWVYGAGRFGNDIKIMLGFTPGLWWKICWLFFSPAFLTFVLIFQWVKYTNPRYGSVTYPAWAEALGWLMALSSIIWIPIVALILVYRELGGTVWQRFYYLTLPTVYWGPALTRHRKLVDYVDKFEINPWNQQNQSSTIQTIPTIMTLTRSNSVEGHSNPPPPNTSRLLDAESSSGRLNHSYSRNLSRSDCRTLDSQDPVFESHV